MLADVRYALRMLLKSPAFSAVAILTLALGIGANTAIFSVVNGVLLRPLPFPHPDQLVSIWESKDFPAGFQGTAAPANLRDWKAQNTVFSGLAGYRAANVALQAKAEPERLIGATVSPEYFELLSVRPLLGRGFTSGEDQPGNDRVVVISEELWRTQFAADPAIVGQAISIDTRRHVVVGVMPARFRMPSARTQIWLPLALAPPEQEQRGSHYLFVLGRLRDGVSIGQARAQMQAIARTLEQKYPEEQKGRSVKLVPLKEELTAYSRRSLFVVLGSVACILLIASVNIANLLLARAAGRQREIALRLAVGASRVRLLRQFLTESIVLATLGAVAGIVMASWLTNVFVGLLGGRVRAGTDVHLDATVLCFTFVVTTLVAVICGLAPARQALGSRRSDLQAALHGHTRVAGANRIRAFLVAAEIALAVVLLSGAGLLLRTFVELLRTNSGFSQPERVLTARVSLPIEQYPNGQVVTQFYQRVLERIQQLPGVRSAGLISALPLIEFGFNGDIEVEGHPFAPGEAPLVEWRAIDGDYFSSVGVQLLAGRFLDHRDRAGAPDTVVINRAFARRVWKTEADALGARVKIDRPFTVVGVVSDVRQADLARPPAPELYFSVAQGPAAGPGQSVAQAANLVIRAVADDPSRIVSSVRNAVRDVDPTLPLFRIQTLQNVISDSVADRRLDGTLVSIFASVALGLAALGLYGLVSFGVAQRTRELGVRIAIGAQRMDLFRLVLGGGMKIVASGLGAGLFIALLITPLLKSMLYGIAPNDPLTIAGVCLLLGVVALLANFLPAQRATKVNPMIALRHE